MEETGKTVGTIRGWSHDVMLHLFDAVGMDKFVGKKLVDDVKMSWDN